MMSTSSLSTSNTPRPTTPKAVVGIQLLSTQKGEGNEFYRIAPSPVSRQLAMGSDNNLVYIWTIGDSIGQRTLQGHTGHVYAVAWSPDGKRLASSSGDKTVKVWDVISGTTEQTISFEESTLFAVAWSPDGNYIAVSSHNDVAVVEAATGTLCQLLSGHTGTVYSVCWSADSARIASSAADNTVRIWDWLNGEQKHVLSGHTSEVLSVSWSPDGTLIASGSADKTVCIWDAETGTLRRAIEGHQQPVTAALFSPDGRFLISQSSDAALRLIRCDTWSVIASLSKPNAPRCWYLSTPGFLDNGKLLATSADQNTSIQLWKLDSEQLLSQKPPQQTIHYTNAKVVLVGDTGVGKSGLGLVLAGKPFQATTSTHKRQVYALDTQIVPTANNTHEIHEIILWDLAGQPGYRLINQLHLSDVSVALVVYDSRNEVNPFSGVEHWLRALQQAQALRGPDQPPIKIFLIAARVDRGSVGVSRARVDEVMRVMHADQHFETSAKEGWNIAELGQAIREAIDWEVLPKVSSSTLLTRIRAFLIDQQAMGQSLFNQENLYYYFLKSAELPHSTELRAQFDTCIDLFASRGLIEKLSFGDIILLQPEMVDSYASALVNAARREPDGLGCVQEDLALSGNFPIPPEDRLHNPGQEKILLIATVEKLLRHEIALRVRFDDVSYLVFPSQQTRDRPADFVPQGGGITFRFDGPIQNIYTTLIVRLAQSGLFKLHNIWKNAVEFTSVPSGSACGLFLEEITEGQAELRLFYGEDVNEYARFQFEEYTHAHLKRRAVGDSLSRHQVLTCPTCQYVVPDRAIQTRLRRNLDWLECPICETRISFAHIQPSSTDSKWISKMDQVADEQRKRATAVSTVGGKRALQSFDVFLCHNTADKAQVRQIGAQLRDHGLLPWLDEWELRPGMPCRISSKNRSNTSRRWRCSSEKKALALGRIWNWKRSSASLSRGAARSSR
jgi:WD40 repeat protein